MSPHPNLIVKDLAIRGLTDAHVSGTGSGTHLKLTLESRAVEPSRAETSAQQAILNPLLWDDTLTMTLPSDFAAGSLNVEVCRSEGVIATARVQITTQGGMAKEKAVARGEGLADLEVSLSYSVTTGEAKPKKKKGLFGKAPNPNAPQTMGEALRCLSAASLAHDKVLAIRQQPQAGQALREHGTVVEEPQINTRAQFKEWKKWAVEMAKRNADTVQPRRQTETGPAKLPLFASSDELLQTLGIVPALYLDFLKFCGGICVLGALISLPSILFNVGSASSSYSASELANSPPLGFLALSIGARTACSTSGCEVGNVIAAVLEVLFSLLLLAACKAFQSRVKRLAETNDANNVFTREYAVSLYGMHSDATPEQIKDHVEKVLEKHTSLTPSQCKVFDVALINNSSVVLKNALKQAPLERKWAILSKRLENLLAFRREKHTGYDLSSRIYETTSETREVADKLLEAREKIASAGFETVTTVCGAFVTFEEQPAAREMLHLYSGGLKYLLQKGDLRFGSSLLGTPVLKKRLRAFPATQPRDVLHEVSTIHLPSFL